MGRRRSLVTAGPCSLSAAPAGAEKGGSVLPANTKVNVTLK
jgi:hypothetical protein